MYYTMLTPYDKCGRVGEVYHVLRIVSGRKRFSFDERPINFCNFLRYFSYMIYNIKFSCKDVCLKI